MELVSFVPAAALGYYTLNVVTHPTKSRVWKKLTQRPYQTKRVQVFPSIRIYTNSKIIHLHHWFNFSMLLLVSAFITSPFLDSAITRGFLVGGVIQGLSFTEGNARKLIYHRAKDPFAHTRRIRRYLPQ